VSGSTPLTDEWICERLRHFGMPPLPGRPVVWRDTSRYMSIERDHIVDLEGDAFLIRGNEHEGRFGLDDQPKFWVKRALDLQTGQTHILKLVIQESFKVSVGGREVLCVRSGQKESNVLNLVRGDPRFMQGHTACDGRGNPVRVIDFIRGTDLLTHLDSLRVPHQEYCRTLLPAILAKVADNIAALGRLHDAGLCHGDIRNDHLLVERATGSYKWIDFDLEQGFPDFDVWSVGNILHYVVAKGFMTFRDAVDTWPELSGKLSRDDASVFFPHRVMNLRRIYSYLPGKLNRVLLRFSFGASACYDRISQITDDLREGVASLGG
jgi:serine/threonine protein kinase